MKGQKRLAMSVMGWAASGGAVLAGEEAVPSPPPPAQAAEGCDWCKCLTERFGAPLYENEEAWLIQAVSFFGRAQFQFAAIDGEDVAGNDFSGTFEEIRRLRFGAEVRALQYFTLKANANFEDDQKPSGGDRDIGYDSLDVALVSFDAGKMLGGGAVDGLTVNYGRHKVLMGQEVHTSSNRIKTVERSAPANKIYPERMTGVTVDASKGPLSGTVGVFTTDASPEIANWGVGEAYYGNLTYGFENGDEILLDFLYNDASGSDDNEVPDNVGSELYEWALSLAYVGERGPWEFMVNGIVGDNGDPSESLRSGMFYGLVLMPSYWILADKLEAVARYAFQASEEDQGIRANSRYLRRDHGGDVDGGWGDRHHSIYAGLNYYFCGHNAKMMAGAEFETLDTVAGDVEALTWWLAWRMYF